jgi:hypothetical protein
MRKISYAFTGLVVLILTFSLGHQVGSQTKSTAIAAAAARADVPDPFALMVKYGKDLPTEKWSEPF